MEKVQLNLERLLPELRDLERKKVFTKLEVNEIAAKRRVHEIACAKRDVQPVDYLRYIEYEARLEKLRKVRASRLQTTTKKTLSDHSIAAHITQLHRLSTRRFPASLALWDAFLAHALSRSSPVLVSRTLTAAIAMHPTHVPYWIMASRWESDGDRKGMGGGNEEAARRLCMRALRFLKGTEGEQDIWKEWVRVEVLFAERMRERWAILGISKLPPPKTETAMDIDEEDEGENSEAVDATEVPPNEHVDAAAEKIAASAVSGQEALREGAVARVVIDSCLLSYSHSIAAYKLLLSVLRDLPSSLRLSLLSHVYTSLTVHHTSSSSSYPTALRILATRHLYDLPFDPTQVPVSGEGVKVQGEALVDAVGDAVNEFWAACKGRKGKGKAKDKAPVEVWEVFCMWLEQIEGDAADEELIAFLRTNLASALSLAPPSPTLALLHLRHLRRTSAPDSAIITYAASITSRFGAAPHSEVTREEAWVARLETLVDVAPSAAIFEDAVSALPFSSRIWNMYASWVEDTLAPADIHQWYLTGLARVQRLDAFPPVSFPSPSPPPRELVPQRFLDYLSSDPQSLSNHLPALLATPLSLSFLAAALALPSLPPATRALIHTRAVGHSEAGVREWLAFAKELMEQGQLTEANEVVRRAGRALGQDKEAFEKAWVRVCDEL